MSIQVLCVLGDLSHDYQVLSGAILQQVFVVEFTVHHHMCDECHRREARDFWRAVVQVRQKVWVYSSPPKNIKTARLDTHMILSINLQA